MRLVPPVRRLVVLGGLLVLALPAAAQSPAGRALPPPPDARFGGPPEPAAESDAADALGGSSLTRVGEWGYGPTYAIADNGSLSGQGRVLRRRAGMTVTDTVMPGLIRDIATSRTGQPGVSYAYVATSHATDPDARGLFIVRFTPADTQIVGRVTGGTALAVTIVESGPTKTAYLARFIPALGSYVLTVVDVTNPAAPSVEGEVAIGGDAQGIAVSGTTAYVAGGSGGVFVVDVSAPAAPAVVRVLEAGVYDRRVAVGRDTEGDLRLAVASGAYSPQAGTVTLFDLSAPLAPAFSCQYQSATVVEDVTWYREFFSPRASVYAAASYGGVVQLDPECGVQSTGTAEPANLVSGAYRVLANTSATDATLITTADYYYGVLRFGGSLGNVASLLEVGKSFSYGVLADAADPNTVYAAAGAYGVARLRAEADGRLVETGRAHDPTWNFTYGAVQNATHLYVADGYSGIQVVDKASMTRVGALGLSFVNTVFISEDGQTLFAVEAGDLVAYSLANPALPAFLWRRSGLDPATVSAREGIAFVGEAAGSNVRVLSLADPTNPVEVGTVPSSGTNVGVALGGGRLYAFGGATDVSVFGVAAPGSPVFIGVLGTSGGSAFDVRNGALYIAGAQGVTVYDATAPPEAPVLASYNAGRAGALYGIEATAADVFLAEGPVGVERLAAQVTTATEAPAAAASSLSVSPNPTLGRVAVAFSLAEAGPAEVDVVDVLGRRVAVLATGPAVAGAQRTEWDGRDGAGRAVAPGVYLVRVRAEGTVRTRTLTVVR